MNKDKKILEIINSKPTQKIGLDDFYGRQAVMNMLREAINYSQCCGELKDKYPQAFEEFAETKAKKQQVEAIYWYNDKSYWTKEHLYEWWQENKENL